MGSISRAYALSQMGDFASAAEALRVELLESGSTSEWVSLCEWIAACLERAGEFEEAGGWYEGAAELALLELGTRPSASASDALHFFELAALCYRRDGRVVSAPASRAAMLSRLLSTRCPPV